MGPMKGRIWLLLLGAVAILVLISGFDVRGQDAATEEKTEIEEKFEGDIFEEGWESRVLIGNPDGNYLNQNRKRLSFTLPATEAFVMLVNQEVPFSDVHVEGTFDNLRSTQATAAVMCRYSEDGWYELRIGLSGNEAGSYKLMKYDAYLKDQYKNPYVLLHPGMDRYMTGDIQLGPNKKNTIGLVCNGDEFRVFINGKEQFPKKNGKITDDQFEEGASGFSIQSYGKGIVDVDVTKFTAIVP